MKSIKEIGKMLEEEGFEPIYAKEKDGEFLQIFCTDENEYMKISYIRNIFFDEKNNVDEMSLIFLDICNESLLKEIKKTSKKIKKLIKNFNKMKVEKI